MNFELIGGPWNGSFTANAVVYNYAREVGYRWPTCAERAAYGWGAILVWWPTNATMDSAGNVLR